AHRPPRRRSRPVDGLLPRRRGKHARIDGGAAALIGWQLLFALGRRTLRCPAVAFLATGVRSTTESTEITERCRRSAGIIRISCTYSHALAKRLHPVRGRNSPRPQCLRGDNFLRALGVLSASAVTTHPRPRRLRGEDSPRPRRLRGEGSPRPQS